LQHGFHNLTKQDKNFCLALQRYLDELNGKKDELKAAHRLQQRRFNELKKSGDDNIRSLALVTRRLCDNLDDMIKKREVLLRCIERCRKNERLDEKVDPFMLRWKLEPLETLDTLSDTNATLYFPTEVDPDGFALRPSKIDHHLLCECNPCTCEVQAEEVDQTGLNAPIGRVSWQNSNSIQLSSDLYHLSTSKSNFGFGNPVYQGIFCHGKVLDSLK